MNASAGGARILVVDDEIHLAEGLRDVLEGEGYRVAVAHDGAEASRRRSPSPSI